MANNFITNNPGEFIDNSGGKYILDRQLVEQINNYDEEEILDILHRFENDLLDKKTPKNNTVYDINKFQRKEDFLQDIDTDIQLFKDIKEEIENLDIINNDPKRATVINEIKAILDREGKKRKVIIFSEYVDTINHLEGYFREMIGNKVLVCAGKVTKELANHLNTDFNAQFKGTQSDDFDVFLTSDKLSEGFNLNRAGAIINYDIPWNPTRVIQRVGRINRIGSKVFDELFIYNFFPSEAGASIVKSREIAAQKMFLIHNSLGEDSKIFDSDEVPTPAGLFNRINDNPDANDELNLATVIRNKYKGISDKYPEVIDRIANLSARVKSAKRFEEDQVNVLRKKGLSFFAQTVDNPGKSDKEVKEIIIEELLDRVECEFDEKHQGLSKHFWPAYESIKNYRVKHKSRKSDASVETKAFNNLKLSLKIIDPKEETLAVFIKVLIKDIRNYRTLSQRTLGRLGRKDLSPNSTEKAKKAFFDEVRWIRNHLGADYLNRILKRVEHQENELIIAVENRNKSIR